MSWRKLGQVDLPDSRPQWMVSHAAVPVAEVLDEHTVRVYFSSRDSLNRSHTGALVLDVRRPTQVLHLDTEPILSPGDLGCFDDSGAMATWLTRRGERRMLYYIGWNLGITVPFRNAIGVAVSDANGPFRRYSPGPIVDRSAFEPHFVGSCCVLEEAGLWSMWYLACVSWEVVAGHPRHRYHLRYAESADGIRWRREGTVAVNFKGALEYAISRPSVLHDGYFWKMWFSARGDRYRIGYAESSDGIRWERHDGKAGLDVSQQGWDSEMVEYPCVFVMGGERYMLYNGNGYGRTGFGLAIEERV